MTAVFEATWESVGTHRVPDWYDDAKLGVFIHWGLYSVPAWAPRVPDIQELLLQRGPRQMFRENPYAEWYLNTMQIEGSSTQRHHRDAYGDGYPYDDFVDAFNDASSPAAIDTLAALCQDAGARYAVLTTKHSDGFALWPSAVPHPVKGEYHASRDLVGDLSDAVRARGLRMGLYYCGGYDWPYSGTVVQNLATAVLSVPQDRRYLDYVSAHVRELIDRYRPSILWNDVAWPRGGNLAELFAYYYNTVADGLVNDRWAEQGPRNTMTVALVRAVGGLVERLWSIVPKSRKTLAFPSSKHFDFRTPEYAPFRTASELKWELCRGVGHSFGANSHERPEDILSTDDLITLFCDVVSKNGNLLIGVGPRPDGTIPEHEQAPLRGLGKWLVVNGAAVYGSRPWTVAESSAPDGKMVRFTRAGPRDDANQTVYAMVIGRPPSRRISLPVVDVTSVRQVRLLGVDEPLEVSTLDGTLTVTLPDRCALSAVTTLVLGRGVRAKSVPRP
ncbi:MAG: alpha-L-fucosidase [Acidimicrobiales bacterium]|nr:alpha-L-fucosidase [Acidimicrobiales bacterium]